MHVNGIASDTVAGNLLTAKFQWDFGDTGSKYNRLVGWTAAHLYTQPGKYTIKLTITNENGKTSFVTRTIQVAASNRKVIYVSNDGSDSNSGLSPQSAVKTFNKAMSMINDDTEVLFNRGDKFDVTKGGTIDNSNVRLQSMVRAPAGFQDRSNACGSGWDRAAWNAQMPERSTARIAHRLRLR